MAQENGGTSIRNASGTITVPVWATVMPETVDEVADAVRRSSGRISVSATRLSPDHQFALEGSLHLDLSRLNKVVRFEPMDGTIRVQAGARWSDLLRFIQPHGFALQSLPQYADFSIGGAVAMNATGRGVAVGPVSASVLGLRVVLADATVVDCDPHNRPDLFAAVIGGLGGIAVIVEVSLRLARNGRLLRKSVRMPVDQYVDHFKARIASDPGAVFHVAEFSLPSLKHLRATTWVQTEERCTDDQPLHYAGMEEPLRRVFDRTRVPTWFGRLRDELLLEPLQYARKVVHWRNYEASLPITVLDPRYLEQPQLDLQQFIIGASALNRFLDALREIVGRYRIPLATLSITHYGACTVSLLSLSRDEAFGVQLGVPSRDPASLQTDHAAWSRELIDAAIACGGRFHPGYAMHATAAQFRSAFAGVDALLAVRAAVDPGGRIGNGAWTAWLESPDHREVVGEAARSEFHALMADAGSRDMAFRILSDCGPAGYGPRLFGLMQRVTQRNTRDELIYRNLRGSLAKWQASPLAVLTMRPTGWRRDLHRQFARHVADVWRQVAPETSAARIDGLVEIGSGGQLASALRRRLRIHGAVQRLGLDGRDEPAALAGWWSALVPARVSARPGAEVGWGGGALPPASADLVTLLGGLAAIGREDADAVLAILAGVLRPGGLLLLLEHDAATGQSALEASMAVTLAGLCAGDPWEDSQAHPRAFRAADEWVGQLIRLGFEECAPRERIRRTQYGDTLLTLRRR